MLPQTEKLTSLSRAYLNFLINQDLSYLKPYLSLDFIKRQQITEQLKLINKLPRFISGHDVDVHLFENYNFENPEDPKRISPFQFEVTYSSYSHVIETEKTTITIFCVVYENQNWIIESVLSPQDEELLKKMVKSEKHQAQKG